MACKISIEKDWSIVIAENEFQEEENKEDGGDENKELFTKRLATINATSRRIDLTTAILSPLAAGLIMSFLNLSPVVNGIVISALFFALWNAISFIVEYNLLASVYRSIPKLEKTKIDMKIKEKQNKMSLIKNLNPFRKLFDGWHLYINQGLVLIPSIAFSLLFLTVLSFDNITIGYAKSQGLTETFLSVIQGLGSVCGVLGTFAFPLLHNKLKISLPYVGVIGSCVQFVFLVLCCVAMFLKGSAFELADKIYKTNSYTTCSNTTTFEIGNQTDSSFIIVPKRFLYEDPCKEYSSIILFLLAMALSRFGLWLTDLTINQIIQESVNENDRGVIGGVQSSLNRIFDLIKYVCVVFLSDIKQYGYLVIISASAIFAAICLYMIYVVLFLTRNKYSQVSTRNSDEEENKSTIRKSMIVIYKGGEQQQQQNNDESEMANITMDHHHHTQNTELLNQEEANDYDSFDEEVDDNKK
jgi:iron-regulated transporter 1